MCSLLPLPAQISMSFFFKNCSCLTLTSDFISLISSKFNVFELKVILLALKTFHGLKSFAFASFDLL